MDRKELDRDKPSAPAEARNIEHATADKDDALGETLVIQLYGKPFDLHAARSRREASK